MINFTGNFINYTDVLKRTPGIGYTDQKVAFVELDTTSPHDKKFINTIKNTWNCPMDFVKCMSDNFDILYKNQEELRLPRIFALTKQLDSFDKLDSSKALGLVQTNVNLKNNIDIELLQTNPLYINQDGRSDIRYIGSTILDSIKEIFCGKKLTLFSTEDALPFYLKNKFRPYNTTLNEQYLLYEA